LGYRAQISHSDDEKWGVFASQGCNLSCGQVQHREEGLDAKAAAELLGVSERTIKRRIKAGHIPAYRLPGGGLKYFIKRSELEAVMEPVEEEHSDK